MFWLDTRDLQEELEELELLEDDEENPMEDFDKERLDELRSARESVGEAWYEGEGLIPEDEFVDYAEQFAKDVCEGDFDAWPLNHIDWDEAADSLLVDYAEIEFDGITYYYRNY